MCVAIKVSCYLAQVREVAHSIDPGLEVVTCGSYRRGRPMCGDVDLLITHPNGRSHRGVFSVLMQRCRDAGVCVCVCVCV